MLISNILCLPDIILKQHCLIGWFCNAYICCLIIIISLCLIALEMDHLMNCIEFKSNCELCNYTHYSCPKGTFSIIFVHLSASLEFLISLTLFSCDRAKNMNGYNYYNQSEFILHQVCFFYLQRWLVYVKCLDQWLVS